MLHTVCKGTQVYGLKESRLPFKWDEDRHERGLRSQFYLTCISWFDFILTLLHLPSSFSHHASVYSTFVVRPCKLFIMQCIIFSSFCHYALLPFAIITSTLPTAIMLRSPPPPPDYGPWRFRRFPASVLSPSSRSITREKFLTFVNV